MAKVIDRPAGDGEAALARLTEREKQVLRLWLEHKTAKEIALEIGVSHYAVEKRLKMARTKLAVSTSLEAARMLAEKEGYQQMVAQPAEVEKPVVPKDRWFTRPLALGVTAMSIFAAMVLIFAAQTGSVIEQADEADGEAAESPDVPGFMSAAASPEQVDNYIAEQFAGFDRDGSGFVEEAEGPSRVTIGGCCGVPRQEFAGEAAWERFKTDNHDDGDNRVSFAEFREARFQSLLDNGIPVRRKDVTVLGERGSPYTEPRPGEEPRTITSDELEYVAASPERVRAYVRQMFDAWDKDGSGFVEVAEAPALLITQQARLGADGTATYDPLDPGKQLEGDAARRQYIANVDIDGDGRISFEEFAEPVMPQFLERGIPLIPADWTQAAPGARGEG